MADLCDRAIKAFKDRLPTFYQQCKPLLDPLISLMVERIHLDLETNDLAPWRNEETAEQLEIRNIIVGHLMNELRHYNKEIQFDEAYEHDVFTIAVYWYLKDDSAQFLREREKGGGTSLSQPFFQFYEGRIPRSVPRVIERGLAYCSPSAPVFVERGSLYESNSFFGDRDPQTGVLKRPDYFDEGQAALPKIRPRDKEQQTHENLGNLEHKTIKKRKRQEDCSQDELSRRYLSILQNTPAQLKLRKEKHALDPLDDHLGHRGERPSISDHSHEEPGEDECNEETEKRLQEKLSARYLSRIQRQARCDQRAAPNVALPEEHSTTLGRIPTQKVLRHILETTDKEFHERYGAFLSLHGMGSVQVMLAAALTPNTRSILTYLETRSIGISELLEIGGNPQEEDGPGVYLHILWTHHERFWLYVGQSINLRDRIQKHCDKKHRKLNPSLRYSVWDSDDIIGDGWVTLSLFTSLNLLEDDRIPPLAIHERELLLNLEEMFLACVFQTLRRHHLERYLPTGISMPWAGSHLNLALPLWQGFSTQSGDVVTRQTFVDAIHSSDPTLRKWAASWRNAYNSLRYSPDPRLRGYWAKNMEIVQDSNLLSQGLKSAQEGVQKAKKERYHELLNSGRILKVH